MAYQLCVETADATDSLIDQIVDPSFYSDEYASEALELWKKIALWECLEYLAYQMEKVRFTFHPGEKTISMFSKMLDDFSVSQIYCIIYKSVDKACREKQSRNLSTAHAANTVIYYCGCYADNIKLKGWGVGSYQRIKDLPQCELSRYFFNSVIRIGDKGFENVPNLNDLMVVNTDAIVESNEEQNEDCS